MLTAIHGRRAKSAARPARKPARPESVRAAILDAARTLYFTQGADGVSARKIASAVGCSATTIYIYYKNLDDLLHHLRMEGFSLLTAYLQRAKGKNAITHVIDMGRAYFRFGIEHPNYYDLMFLYRFREVPKPEVVQREVYALTLLRDVVKDGIENGDIRDDLDLMALTNGLWAEVHGITSLAVSGRLWQTAPGHHQEVLDAIFDGMERWLTPRKKRG
jgi:AcrR family transcriptional regulator